MFCVAEMELATAVTTQDLVTFKSVKNTYTNT